MASYRYLERITNPVLSQSVTGVTPVKGPALSFTSMNTVCFQFNYTGTLAATFQVLGSLDGVNYADLNAVIAPATGATGSSIGTADCSGLKYVVAQITPSSGTSTVVVLGRIVAGS